QERAQRKPNIVGFDANGPRNQGARHQGKLPELGIHEPPFEKASSPDLDPFGIQEPSPTFFTTSGPDTRPKGMLDFKAPEVPAHNNIVASLLATTSGDVATLRPKYNDINQLRKTVVAVEVSSAKAPAKDSISRKLSQVDDSGSPMPYGGEIYQGTALVPRTRQKSITTGSALANFATHQATDETFARPTALARNEMARSESPLQEMCALPEDLPPPASQPITHAGFDRDTQLTAEHLQILNLHKDAPKHVSPVPLQSSPRKAAPIQKSLGILEALRSEVVQRTDAPGAKENDGKESPETEEPMDEDDPDKTLVNEDSDDGGDSDDDGSGSRNSSDTDGDEVAKSALSMWRNALKSHQGDVYDQLVRIAHRLTNHLKDHETAIKDINTDYSQDGTKLIQRLVKDNKTKLEQYCTKKSKIQGALVMGCEQVCGSLYKDMKDVKASRERIVKSLQRRVDAVGRLDQILQTYQA
ncbi:hypothetical protein KCU78_g12077, partial [Aureobasidium melanogenum]